MDGARINRFAETVVEERPNHYQSLSFEQIHQQTKKMWNDKLGIYQAKGSPDQLAMFYTSLYHTMINPSIYQDVDGKYRGVDHNIHQNLEGYTNYTIFSLWDTYRAEHPLLNIIDPKSASDMAESMLNHARQSVHHVLPVWSHAGNENFYSNEYGFSVNHFLFGLLPMVKTNSPPAIICS